MEMTNEEKMLMQRAALMGFISAVLEDEGEKTLDEIKAGILSCLSTINEFDCRVHDFIEDMTFNAANHYCDGLDALNEVDRILNND